MPMPLLRAAFPDVEIDYPETDGELMAESDVQRTYLSYAVEALRLHFRARSDVYVSGNLLLYYVEGDPRQSVAPDCFVAFGVPNHDRQRYKLWEEGQPPAFVLEITSQSTRAQDCGAKRGLYAYLKIREYWQYDPTGDYLKPRLRGLTLEGEDYRELQRGLPEAQDFYLLSPVLGLELHLRAGQLRFRDPRTGLFLPSLAEADAARIAAEQRADRLAAQLRALGVDPTATD